MFDKKAYQKEYRQKNQDVIKKNKREWGYNKRWVSECIPFKLFWKKIEKERIDKENRKKRLQATKNWRSKNKEHLKQYYKIRDPIYYQKNKDRIDNRNKEYDQKNKEYLKRKQKEWREENRDKLLVEKKIDYRKNRDRRLKQSKKRYGNNRNEYLQRSKEYYRTNPEKVYKQNIKQLKKFAIPFKKPYWEYSYALMSWSKMIKKRDKVCVICGSKDKINSHHILHKAKYPELSLNINNGILLCKNHHREAHGWIYA